MFTPSLPRGGLPLARVLTAAAVRALRPAEDRREIPDGGIRGLRLLIQPSGARSWIMRFRRPDGRSAKLTLGTVNDAELGGEPVIGGHLTLAAARRLAAEVHRQRALGRDPAADYVNEKRARADARRKTFDGAALAFIEEHARPKTRRWRETAALLGFNAELDIVACGLAQRWRKRPIAEITAHDIYSTVAACRNSSRARHLYSALSTMFGWLLERRVIEKNPCDGVARPEAPNARDRVLSDDELRWFWGACARIDEPFGPMFRLLLLTGARLREVAEMTHRELSDSTWTIPATRTKNGREHKVPLQPAALDIIAGVRRIAGKPGYVFTTNGRTPVSGFSVAKKRLDREMAVLAKQDGAELKAWRLHDLRRTAATGMARAGADLHVIERALNHVSGSFGGIVGVYQRHKYEAEVKAALEAWGRFVTALAEGKTDNVVAPHEAV
jgi:integrase